MTVCNHLDDQALSKLLMKSTHHRMILVAHNKIREAYKKIRVAHKDFPLLYYKMQVHITIHDIMTPHKIHIAQTKEGVQKKALHSSLLLLRPLFYPLLSHIIMGVLNQNLFDFHEFSFC